MILTENLASVDRMDKAFRGQPVDMDDAGCRMVSAIAGVVRCLQSYDIMANSEIVELKETVANREGFYTHWADCSWKKESRTRMKNSGLSEPLYQHSLMHGTLVRERKWFT